MENDEREWEYPKGRRRKGEGRVINDRIRSDILKFYVANIPDGCRPWDLANRFREFGEIAGAFIAKKRNKEGLIFGFVSFKGIKDGTEMEKSLKNVKLGMNKLIVNIALFAAENQREDQQPVHVRNHRSVC